LYLTHPEFRIGRAYLNRFYAGGISMNFLTKGFSSLRIISIIVSIVLLPLAFTYADEIEQAPVDPDISDICTLSDCNPAKPCASEGESCYTLNGAFYCCVEPPSGGAEAVGD
jgi:hypothetical protein